MPSWSPRILVVEDEWLIAEDLKERLEELGATVLGPVTSCSAALESLWTDPPDFAFVDHQLGSETCEVVLDECDRQGIPVVVASGAFVGDLPKYLEARKLLGKPIPPGGLESIYATLSLAKSVD